MNRPPNILIDGYNLLFQSHLVGRGRGADWLFRARQRLLRYLESRLDDQELLVTEVVFDARANPDTSSGASSRRHSGLVVTFAHAYPQADDLLEQVIRRHPHPKRLEVISTDIRIRKCAQARRARPITSESFLDELERRPRRTDLLADRPPANESSFTEEDFAEEMADEASARPPAESRQREQGVAETELQEWLRAFGFDQHSQRDRATRDDASSGNRNASQSGHGEEQSREEQSSLTAERESIVKHKTHVIDPQAVEANETQGRSEAECSRNRKSTTHGAVNSTHLAGNYQSSRGTETHVAVKGDGAAGGQSIVDNPAARQRAKQELDDVLPDEIRDQLT